MKKAFAQFSVRHTDLTMESCQINRHVATSVVGGAKRQ